jgi:hypothetical protein
MLQQAKEKNETPPDMVALYRKCIAVVTRPCGPEWRGALLEKVLQTSLALGRSAQSGRGFLFAPNLN